MQGYVGLLLAVLLAGCSAPLRSLADVGAPTVTAPCLLPQATPTSVLDQLLAHGEWLSHSTAKERQRAVGLWQGHTDVLGRVQLAMLNSHPDAPLAAREAAFEELEHLLAALDDRSRLLMRQWLLQGMRVVAKEHEQRVLHQQQHEQQHQQLEVLRQQIRRLSAIDERFNQRKQVQYKEVMQ
ncbi:MAG: hypothetical protein ACRCYV_00895 [Aeromonas sp.]